MSGNLLSLQRRLARVERRLVDIANSASSGECDCRKITVADAGKPEEFEREMNRGCRVHPFRDLGEVVIFSHAGQESGSAKLDQLLQIYLARRSQGRPSLSQLRKVGVALRDES